jgi:pantothenate kinase
MDELIKGIAAKTRDMTPGHRYIVGIVGFPGAGKSTLAERLVRELNALADAGVKAQLVPMDGFHLPNAVLDERGLRPLKGIPETFDGEGFVKLMKDLRAVPAARVGVPGFDRSLDEPTRDAIIVEPHHNVLVVEGNYLLVQEHPWSEVRTLLDEAWFLDVEIDTIIPRLMERHVLGGRSPEAAREKMESTDLRNARLIEKTRPFATRVVGGGIT